MSVCPFVMHITLSKTLMKYSNPPQHSLIYEESNGVSFARIDGEVSLQFCLKLLIAASCYLW